jgi:hypothetical protein
MNTNDESAGSSAEVCPDCIDKQRWIASLTQGLANVSAEARDLHIKLASLQAQCAEKEREIERLSEILEAATDEVSDYANVATPPGVPLEPSLSWAIQMCRADMRRQINTALAAQKQAEERLDQKEADRQYHMNQINRLARATDTMGETSQMVIHTSIDLIVQLRADLAKMRDRWRRRKAAAMQKGAE